MDAKDRRDQIQEFTFENMIVEPYSDEMEGRIGDAVEVYGFEDRVTAVTFLKTSGQLDDINRFGGMGGEVINRKELTAEIARLFQVSKRTAARHIARAQTRKLHPEWTPPPWGGTREGAGRPYGAENKSTAA